jgi:thioredoxin reductase
MGRGAAAAPPATASFWADVCVVGGGNTAVEEALYLSNTGRGTRPPTRCSAPSILVAR